MVSIITMYMKYYARLIGWKRVHSHVTRVQITNSACALPKFTSVFTLCDVLSLALIKVTTWFLVKFVVNKHLKFFQRLQIAPALRARQFCCLWKIYLCLLTQNCTRNYVITYTNKVLSFLCFHNRNMRLYIHLAWSNVVSLV